MPTDLRLRKILESFKNGTLSASEAEANLHGIFSHDVETDSAVIDLGREIRVGFPEAIYAESKTPSQVVEIFKLMEKRSGKALATRCSDDTIAALKSEIAGVNISEISRIAWIRNDIEICAGLSVAVVAAGTSDLPVSEEAAVTLEFSGFQVERVFDVGVAGIHRLFDRMDRISNADAVIVVAGMEGALPSVVGGLVARPVIAVPTSVGYGASFGGVSALLGMLNSCSAGITVVNIDNGFGAAVAAIRILKGIQK